jgi:ribosomal protein S18 acetylase RimI-like enzyme
MAEKFEFIELKEVTLNTLGELHALFPHWKKSSVQKKINATLGGSDRRFVALLNGVIVGHVKVIYGRGLHKHRAEITSLIVDQKHRRHHIGFELMKYVLSQISMTRKLALLAVDSKNKPAIKLYKKLGFEKYGELKKASLVNGKFLDNYLMKKDLS